MNFSVSKVCSKTYHNASLCCRKGVSSSTPETLDSICEENKNALIAELSLAEEDLIKIWVSELQNEEQCGVRFSIFFMQWCSVCVMSLFSFTLKFQFVEPYKYFFALFSLLVRVRLSLPVAPALKTTVLTSPSPLTGSRRLW